MGQPASLMGIEHTSPKITLAVIFFIVFPEIACYNLSLPLISWHTIYSSVAHYYPHTETAHTGNTQQLLWPLEKETKGMKIRQATYQLM